MSASTRHTPQQPDYAAARELLYVLAREIMEKATGEPVRVVLDRDGKVRLVRVVDGGKAAKIA